MTQKTAAAGPRAPGSRTVVVPDGALGINRNRTTEATKRFCNLLSGTPVPEARDSSSELDAVELQVLGAVHLQLDFSAPIVTIEREQSRLLDETPLWDGDVRVVQVVEAHERTIEVSALMTAENSPPPSISDATFDGV